MGKFEEFLNRCRPAVYSVLRIVAALMLMQHGAQKLFGVLGGTKMPLFSLMGLAGVIELVVAGMVAIGLFTRITSFIVSGEMAGAYFLGHIFSEGPTTLWPVLNHGELAALYCFVFLYIATRGAGAFSVDAALAKNKGAESAGPTGALAG